MKLEARALNPMSTTRGKQLWLDTALDCCCVCQIRFGTMIFLACFGSIGIRNCWLSGMSTNSMLWWNPHLTSSSEYCLDNRCCLSSWRHLCNGRGQSDLIQNVRSDGWENRNPYLVRRYCFEKPNPSCYSQETELGFWASNSLLLYKPGGDLPWYSHPISKANAKIGWQEFQIGKDTVISKSTSLSHLKAVPTDHTSHFSA